MMKLDLKWYVSLGFLLIAVLYPSRSQTAGTPEAISTERLYRNGTLYCVAQGKKPVPSFYTGPQIPGELNRRLIGSSGFLHQSCADNNQFAFGAHDAERDLARGECGAAGGEFQEVLLKLTGCTKAEKVKVHGYGHCCSPTSGTVSASK